MAKKTTKKRSRKNVGRPSKGPSIAVNMRMSAQLVKKIDRLEKELTRTAVVERALQKAFKAEEELLDEIIRTS